MHVQVIGMQRPLSSLASLIDRGFGNHTTLELLFVMLVCPLGMNLLQVCTSHRTITECEFRDAPAHVFHMRLEILFVM